MGNQVARTAGRTTSDKVIPPKERNDRWLTPLPIIEALTTDIGYPRFDLDPCGAPGHHTAARVFTLERGDDGLRDSWIIPWSERAKPSRLGQVARLWLNPPYGREKVKWIDRFLYHWENGYITGTMLVPADPGTIAVWQERIFPNASAILFWRHRIDFWSRDDVIGNMPSGKRMVSVNESAIVAFGQLDADALWTAVERDLLPGTVIDFTGVKR
jgi:hypothetical protein